MVTPRLADVARVGALAVIFIAFGPFVRAGAGRFAAGFQQLSVHDGLETKFQPVHIYLKVTEL